MLGVAKVQAVNNGHGRRTDARNIGHRFSDRPGRTGTRVQRAPARVRVSRECESPFARGQTGTGQTQQGRVAARSDHGVQKELRVVLAVDPGGIEQQNQDVLSDVARHVARRVVRNNRVQVVRTLDGPFVERGVVGQGRGRHFGENLAVEAVANTEHAEGVALGVVRRVGHATNDGGAHFPLITEGFDGIPRRGFNDGEHSFLRLGGHDLVGLHVGFALRHGRDVHVHTNTTARGRLRSGADQSGATEVLNTNDVATVEQGQAGFD